MTSDSGSRLSAHLSGIRCQRDLFIFIADEVATTFSLASSSTEPDTTTSSRKKEA
jgi:hypothetical protein